MSFLRKYKVQLVLIGIVFLALLLRLPGFYTSLPEAGIQTMKIVNYDESFSLWLADKPVGELLSLARFDAHPPLYYLLLKLFTAFTPDNIIVATSLSLLFSLAGVVAVFFLGRAIMSPRAGLIAGLLYAVWPLSVEQATNIRMYSLVFLLGALFWLFFWRAVRETRPRFLYLLGLCTVAGLLTHYTFFVLVLTAVVILTIWQIQHREYNRHVWWPLLAGFIIFIPWVLLNGRLHDWLNPALRARNFLDIYSLHRAFGWGWAGSITLIGWFFYPDMYFSGFWLLLVASGVLFVMTVIGSTIRSRDFQLFFWLSLILTIVCCLVFRFYSPRYLILLFIPLSLGLTSIGDSRVAWRWGGALIILSVLIFGLASGHQFFKAEADYCQYGSRYFSEILTTAWHPGDLVVTAPATFYPYWRETDYYVTPKYGPSDLAHQIGELGYAGLFDESDHDQFFEFIGHRERVWLVHMKKNNVFDSNKLMVEWLHESALDEMSWFFPDGSENNQMILTLYQLK
jgi:hypothetical protein